MQDLAAQRSLEALKKMTLRVAELNREAAKKREANAKTIRQAFQA